MPTPGSTPQDPLVLWRQLLRARGLVAAQRHLPQTRLFAEARHQLLHALEAYVESLAGRGRPIPYALRDELRLQRLTCSDDRFRAPEAGRSELTSRTPRSGPPGTR
jgi:hypothetical protein